MASQDSRLLPLIAAERSLRALFLVMVGVVLITRAYADWGRIVRNQAVRWGLDPSSGGLGRLIHSLSSLSPRRVRIYGAVAVGFGCLEGAEAYGLWRRRRWGEWLTVIATSLLFIPEVWELAKRPSGFKVVALVVNAAIVAYLIHRLRRRQ